MKCVLLFLLLASVPRGVDQGGTIQKVPWTGVNWVKVVEIATSTASGAFRCIPVIEELKGGQR